MDKNAPSMLKSTVLGGLICGVAGGLPLIGALNFACCALVAGAGFLASFFYSKECRKANTEFRPGNGAVVGLVAGLFYAIAHALIGRLFMPSGESLDKMVEQMETGGAPPEVVDGVLQFFELIGSGLGILIFFFIILLLAAVFSTIGGLIGGAVFKVELPPPAAPGAPPPPPMQEGGPPASTPR